ncbi:hypothetical protein [Vibrio genomosp. F10]|uniref:hypothetical protein n=1 Tax=Vibrio genomosp. F10 TaxID=723171 RepID=UPI000306CD11|nr:hypothetical protein [Vibrio genomosp. F10]OEF04565.1 hypothetical protein A1QI_10895 [Vibrio genomosp. F10 str. 9ZB36]
MIQQKHAINLLLLPLLIVFYMHLISSSMMLLYANNIIYILIPIFLFSLFYGNKYFLNADAIIFIPFLFFLFVSVLFFNPSLLAYKELVKYLLYFLIFILVVKRNFCYKYVFKVFIYFLVVTFLFMFVVYLFALGGDLEYKYITEDLMLPSSSAYITRTDWDYSLIFYLLSFPINTPEDGILGIPRFYGFSVEPTLYSIVIAPCIFLAIRLRMWMSAVILSFALLVTCSYYALVATFLSLFIGFFVWNRSFALKLSMIICFVFMVLVLPNVVSLGNIRISSYLSIFNNMSNYDINVFGFGIDYLSNKKVIGGVSSLAFKYGYITLFGYMIVVLFYFYRVCITKDWMMVSFYVCSLLMINKSSEAFMPFLIFVFGCISYYYDQFKFNNKFSMLESGD